MHGERTQGLMKTYENQSGPWFHSMALCMAAERRLFEIMKLNSYLTDSKRQMHEIVHYWLGFIFLFKLFFLLFFSFLQI